MDSRPTTLLAELTHRRPLHCPYCSNPLELVLSKAELSTQDWLRVISEARQLGVLQLGLSGGEPLVRRDLEEIAAHAHREGLYTTLVTSAIGLTHERLERLVDAGLEHVQISFQDSEKEGAERIAGTRSWDAKQQAAAWVKEHDLAFSVNVVLHRANLDHLEQIIDMAGDLGADRVELANTQYYGWAVTNRDALMPTRAQVERSTAIADRKIAEYKGRMQIIQRAPRLLQRVPEAVLRRLGRVLRDGRTERQRAALSRGVADHHADVRQRARAQPGVDLGGVECLPRLPWRRVDAGALPELPAQAHRFRRLPLSGVRVDRRRAEHRSGVQPFA